MNYDKYAEKFIRKGIKQLQKDLNISEEQAILYQSVKYALASLLLLPLYQDLLFRWEND